MRAAEAEVKRQKEEAAKQKKLKEDAEERESQQR